MNFDNLFQNSASNPSTSTSTPSASTPTTSSPFSGIEQSLVQDGESILEKAAVGLVAGIIL